MDANQNRREASLQTIRRFPGYLRFLRDLADHGRGWVSSQRIAEGFALAPIQVRKDLEAIGVVGRPRMGYAVGDLVRSIESFLGWDNRTDAFLVGAGHLGGALLGYQGFSQHGLSIVAAFDVNPAVVGRTVYGKKVFPLSKLPDLARRMHIAMGVLTVPAAAAQDAADAMIAAGIRAIWNFAPVKLTVPADVVVQDEDLARGLAVLSVRWADLRARSQTAARPDPGSADVKPRKPSTR